MGGVLPALAPARGEGQGKGEQLLQREEGRAALGKRREGGVREKGAVSRNNSAGGAVGGEGGGAD